MFIYKAGRGTKNNFFNLICTNKHYPQFFCLLTFANRNFRGRAFAFLVFFRESICLWKFENSKTRKFLHAKEEENLADGGKNEIWREFHLTDCDQNRMTKFSSNKVVQKSPTKSVFLPTYNLNTQVHDVRTTTTL